MVFAGSGDEMAADAESVKTPNPLSRAAADDESAHVAPESEGDCVAELAAAPNPEDLLWLRAPFLADFSIEQIYLGELAEANEAATLRMQRVILAKEDWPLWERDETAGPDLFAEAHSLMRLTESDTLGHLVFSLESAASFSAIAPPRDFTGWLSRVAPLPVSQFELPRGFETASSRSGGSSTLHLASNTPAAFAREPPRNARASQLTGVAFIGGSVGSPHFSASNGRAAALLPIERVNFEKVAQKDWGPTKNVLAVGNYLVTADRSLASLKLDGVGTGWDREGYDLGREINLNRHTLTLTGAGLLSVGEKRDKIWNGTLATTRDNFEIHVTGGGPGYGGLEIGAVMLGGASGTTGLVKTGDGELILSNQEKNTFTGEVRIERGTLTLRSKDGAIASKSIFVGDGSSPAILNLKGGRDHINPEATLTLRGGETGEAVLRFEKTHPNKGVVQTLEKLVIEGNGVIEFIDPFITEGKGSSPNKNALYIDELDLRGELTIRGWDQYDTQIFIKRAVQPDEELLSKIHVEGHANLRVTQGPNGYWSLQAAPIPEPATCGAIVATGALALTHWRKRRSLRRERAPWSESAQPRPEAP